MEEIIAIMSKEIRDEGREEASIQIAKNLLAKGSTPEFVQEITGLSPDVIKELDN